MSEIKIVLYIVISVLLANSINFIGYNYLTKTNEYKLNQVLEILTKNQSNEISRKNQDSEIYNGFNKQKLNVTIRNESFNELTCGNMQGNTFNSFLHLDRKQERNFINIEEGESIGCQIKIDDSRHTILNWFNIKSSGVYSLLLEEIECLTCKGVDHALATIVVHPNGKKEYRKL